MTISSRTRGLLALTLLAGTIAIGTATPPASAGAPVYAIDSATPAAGTAGTPYTHTFTGDPTGATFALTAGTLPDGLTLDAATGELSGTPTTPGTATGIDVTATWTDPYTALTAGFYHTCGLTTAGNADCWGTNGDGQATDQTGPYTALTAGSSHTCGLTVTSTADCWGWNDNGQADDQTGPYIALTAGYSHTCGLTPTGTADCWGDNTSGQAADQTGPYTALTAGIYHTCGLTPTGTADCWGDNSYGQADDQTGPYTALTASVYHTCGLTPTGAADCWGNSSYGQADDQTGPYTALTADYYHTCGLTPTGAADCWGDNNNGQADDQPGPYTALTADAFHNCGLTTTGAADCWGYNRFGQATDQAGGVGATDTQTFDLTIAGTISGTVTADPGGTPLAGIRVRLYNGTVGIATATTAIDGTYTLPSLDPAGTYRLRFHDPINGQYTSEYNGGGTNFNLAPTIAVTAGATTTIDADLAGAIPPDWAATGTVTADIGGKPLAGITVNAYEDGVLVRGTVTNASGQFTIAGLDSTGTWTLRYRDATKVHTREFWNNQPTLAAANNLAYTPGGITTADAALLTNP